MAKTLKPIYGPAALSCRFIRHDGQVWDKTNQKLAADTAWADSIITVSKNTVVNGYIIDVPAGLPTGIYDVVIFATETPTTATEIYSAAVWNQNAMEFKQQQIEG